MGTCIICGEMFDKKGKHPNQKTCSNKCSEDNRRNIRKLCMKNYKQNHTVEEIKKKIQDYKERNKEKLKLKSREKYLIRKDTEHHKQYVKKYYEEHKEATKLRAKLHKIKNRETYNKLRKERRANTDYPNTDKYFLYQLAGRLEVSTEIITPELLEAYKQFLQLKREVKNVRTKSI